MPVYKLTNRKNKKGWYFQGYFNGKKYKKESWEGKPLETKAAAMVAETKFLHELELKQGENASIIPIEYAWDSYYEVKKRTIKVNTRASYRTFKAMYLNLLEVKYVSEIKPTTIENWFKKISEKTTSSIAHKNKIISRMKSFITYCVNHYSITTKVLVPLESKIPSKDIINNEYTLYTTEQFEEFLKTFNKNDKYKYIFILLFYTGMRIGELSALQFQDYDSSEGTLNITKSFAKVFGGYELCSPKSKNSTRVIYLDPDTNNELNYYVHQMQLIYNIKQTDFIFGISKPIAQQRIREACKAHSVAAGLPKIKLHEFRHSHASHLAKEGIDGVLIAQRIGDTLSTVQDVYINPLKKDAKELASKIRKKS